MIKFEKIIITICISILINPLFGKSNENTINIEARGTIKYKPNHAIIIIGISSIKPSAAESMNNLRSIEKIFLELCSFMKIKNDDLTTESTSIKREYKKSFDTTSFLGIKSEVAYKITLKKLIDINEFLSKSFEIGMNEYNSINWGHFKIDSLKLEVLELAMKNSKINAETILKSSDRKLGKLIKVSFDKPNDFNILNHSHRIRVKAKGMLRGNYDVSKKDYIKYFQIKTPVLELNKKIYTQYSIK